MAASSLRVLVRWKDAAVFAGEDVECTITFTNVAPPASRPPSGASPTAGSERQQRRLPPVHSSTRPTLSRKSSLVSQPRPPPISRGHRPALSLQTPTTRRPSFTPSAGTANGISNNNNNTAGTSSLSHGRSLSIISLGATAPTAADGSHERGLPVRRPPRGHGRSASLQVVPSAYPGTPLPKLSPGHRSATYASPPLLPPSPHAAPHASALPLARKPSGSFSHNFRFPAAPPPEDAIRDPPEQALLEPPSRSPIKPALPRRHSPRRRGPASVAPDALSPVARIITGSSMDGTSRSSADFGSMSNHSNETLASDYIAQPQARLRQRPSQPRLPSLLAPPHPHIRPECLMMGYAQVTGAFTLDGSLINQAPFEEVKRKGIVGGQAGGGVVGVDRAKRTSGLFGALGWASIGESLGGLLGASEPSSIREMRGLASSKTVPLISTPQSILFVDLKLAPGESRSYTYSFTMPRGLPPSHKGRSIKVTYNLTIGTQRAGSTNEQHVRHVQVPFRVFGSVTSRYHHPYACPGPTANHGSARGEILGHDLMSPYILLRDQARTKTINPTTHSNSPSRINKSTASFKSDENTLADFLQYVDNLLDRPSQDPNNGLLSPTCTVPGRSPTPLEPQTMKDAIDAAILRSNLTGAENQSANRFEIARSGKRVAVIMLARPSYRLGETISAVIDFSDTHIPCYSIHVSLETSEKVDPAIALRSNASIYRVTKKVHASFSENALFARKLAFSPTIPPNATPDFITSGVSLEWKLRVEFITPRLMHGDGEAAAWDDLLENMSRDDRGIILAAVQRLPAESFEVHVPIRVYGAVSGVAEGPDEEGLPV